VRIVPATVEAIAEPRFLKTVLSPVAAPRRCLDTDVLFVPPEELLELEEELLEELELSYFSILFLHSHCRIFLSLL